MKRLLLTALTLLVTLSCGSAAAMTPAGVVRPAKPEIKSTITPSANPTAAPAIPATIIPNLSPRRHERGMPGMPRNFKATGDIEQIILTWDAPQQVGVGIDGYSLLLTPGEEWSNLPPLPTAYNLKATEGHYIVTIVTYNELGISSPVTQPVDVLPQPPPVVEAPPSDTYVAPSGGGGGGGNGGGGNPPTYRPPPPPPAVVSGSYQNTLINSDRGGLGGLSWNGCLANVAYQSALRMANQGFISHAGGANQSLACGLGHQAGENVGYWSGGINDPQINTMFMNSPGHRANIMGPYHYVGTAWVVAKNGYGYIAVEFG